MIKKILQASLAFFALLTIASSLNFSSPFTGGIIDLDDLFNYANQTVPNYINDDNTPNNNQITDIGATLGRVLFYDKNMSTDRTIACASCHQQEHAFGDLDQASQGVDGLTGRHSMRLINARFADEVRFFWDERANSLELQTTQPIQDHIEMGFSGQNGDPSLADLITRLENIDYYQTLFTEVYGDPNITEERMQLALAQFIRSIQSFDSKYDVGRAQVNNNNAQFPNFTTQENNGKQLFSTNPQFNNNGMRTGGGLGCQRCHQAPEFDIDPTRGGGGPGGNNNIGNNGMVTGLNGINDFTNTRSPSLRDFVKADGSTNGDAFHNGHAGGMTAMIEHYNSGIENVQNLDPRLRPGGDPQRLNMTQAEKDALAAFLQTLGGSDVYTNEKWSNPFDVEEELKVVSGALPITSIQWQGTAQDAQNLIQYNLNFTGDLVSLSIERSPDTVNFTEVADLDTDANNGNLLGEWIDYEPLPLAYYRLAITFESGDTEYSDLIVIENELSTPVEVEIVADFIEIYPNPVRDVLFINTNQTFAEGIEIYDVQGRIVLKSQQLSEIDLQRLEAGIYVVKMGEEVRRIVKQ
ncbi:MAG: cytochrome c peroxidase [Saprospiraceae bacterium]